MARKKTGVQMLQDLAKLAVDSSKASNKNLNKSQRRAAQNRINKTMSYYSRSREQTKRPQSVQQKPKPQKRKPSLFERFIESAKKTIMSGHQEKASRLDSYRKPRIEAAKRPESETSKEKPQIGAYSHYRSAVEKQKAYRSAKEKKAKSEAKKAQSKEIEDSRTEQLKALQNLKKDGVLRPDYREKIDKEIKRVKGKSYDKGYKARKTEVATEDLKRKLNFMGANGLVKAHKEASAEIKKKAKAYEKKNKRTQLTTDEALRMQYASSNPTYRAQKGGDKVITKELQEKIRANIQTDLDKGSVGTGFMSGSMPVADLKKSVEKKYGIKLDDTIARQKTSYNIAEMAGYLAKSSAFGGATEESIAKALTKAIAKKTGKQTVGKVGKFAVNRAAEAIAATPINVEDAAKNSKDTKDFAKNLAINAVLDAGLGSTIDGGKAIAKTASDKATRKLLIKLDSGVDLTAAEKKSLQKKATRVAGKKVAGSDLTEVEKKLFAKVNDGQVKKTLEKTIEKNKTAPSAIGGDVSHSLEPKKGSGTPSAEVPSEALQTTNAGLPKTSIPDSSQKIYTSIPEAPEKINTGPESLQTSSAPKKSTYLKEADVAPEYKKTYKEFVDSVDDEIVDYAHKAKNGEIAPKNVHKINGVRKREAEEIESLIDTNIDGYVHVIGPNDIDHIEKRHGTNGRADNTMADLNDIGRIKYVIDNYDHVSRVLDKEGKQKHTNAYPSNTGNGKTRPSPLIMYEKRVDGHIYVVEAVPDTSKKQLRVISAYMNKKAPETVNAKALTVTSDNAFQDASINNIPENSQNINIEAEKVKNEAPKMTAEEIRASVNEITDRELQTHGINLMQSDTVSDDALRAEAMQAIDGGAFGKKTVKNSDVWEQAEKEIAGDLEDTYGHIMKLDGQPSSLDVARCYNLMIKFREQGDSKRWLEMCERASGLMSETGRTLQAARMALRTTPEGRIRIVNRNIEYLNKKYADRLDGKKLELTDSQITKIMEATDDDAIAKVMNEINIETWNQIPATMFEKFNELRHCAMLLNPRTHIRNICGNMIFAPARTISGTISMSLEKGFSKKIEKMGGKKTRSFVNRTSDENLFKAARESFDTNYDASGSANRYIETHRPADSSVFGGSAVGRVFEKTRQFNYKALEKEDMLTFRPVYEKTYAKYLKANGLDPKKMTPEQKVEAHDNALRQAEYATYRDATTLSSAITKLKEKSATAKGENALGTVAYRTGNVVMESMIPFAKTPINIARRGIDYSPLGLAKGVARVASAKSPEAFIKGLDDLGAGLTGTGIVALGGLFADLGYVTVNVGGKSGDPYYERDMGEQDYSINLSIGGKEYSMSMDWAAPLNLPFFAGAAAAENFGKEGGGFSDFVTGLAKIGEPLMEMSFMSGFTSLLQSNAKIDDGSATGTIMTNIMMTMPQQYLGSFIPSVVSQAANVTDQYKRDTGSTSDDPVIKSWEQWARQQINKIPGLRQKLLKKDVDIWGRYTEKQSTKDYIIEGLKATLCPATIKKKTYTNADRELIKLSKELDPETAKYIMPEDTFGYAFDLADGGRMKYSEKGKYQRERGQQNYKELTSLVSSKRYKSMTTEEKKKEIEGIYDLSQTKADRKVYGAKYAIKAIDNSSWGDSTKHQDQAEAYIQRGGSYEKYYNGYIGVEEVVRKSHHTGYEAKAIGLRKAGADDSLYQIYRINKDTKERVTEYFKNNGNENEYYEKSNVMMRKLADWGVTSNEGGIYNKTYRAMAIAKSKSKRRVYKVMDLDSQANIGYGLVKYKYTPSKIAGLKDVLKYDFDTNGNGSANKQEIIECINSLKLTDNTEKALLFGALSQWKSRNPYGEIPNYLWDNPSSGSSSSYSRGYRRYNRGHGGRRGSGSSAEERSEFEKYIESLMNGQKSGSGIDEATMNYGSRRLNTKQYTSDQYRKAVARVLAKKLKA